MKPIEFLAIHHSAGPNTTTAKQILAIHLQKGYRTIGYSHVIEFDGRLVEGRGFRQQLAANPPHNGDSIAVCVPGDMTRDEVRYQWTQAQLDMLRGYVLACRLLFPGIKVGGHRDIGSTPTLCPGFDVTEQWMRIGLAISGKEPRAVKLSARRKG